MNQRWIFSDDERKNSKSDLEDMEKHWKSYGKKMDRVNQDTWNRFIVGPSVKAGYEISGLLLVCFFGTKKGHTLGRPVGGHKASVQLATIASIRTSMSSNPSVQMVISQNFQWSFQISIEQWTKIMGLLRLCRGCGFYYPLLWFSLFRVIPL